MLHICATQGERRQQRKRSGLVPARMRKSRRSNRGKGEYADRNGLVRSPDDDTAAGFVFRVARRTDDGDGKRCVFPGAAGGGRLATHVANLKEVGEHHLPSSGRLQLLPLSLACLV